MGRIFKTPIMKSVTQAANTGAATSGTDSQDDVNTRKISSNGVDFTDLNPALNELLGSLTSRANDKTKRDPVSSIIKTPTKGNEFDAIINLIKKYNSESNSGIEFRYRGIWNKSAIDSSGLNYNAKWFQLSLPLSYSENPLSFATYLSKYGAYGNPINEGNGIQYNSSENEYHYNSITQQQPNGLYTISAVLISYFLPQGRQYEIADESGETTLQGSGENIFTDFGLIRTQNRAITEDNLSAAFNLFQPSKHILPTRVYIPLPNELNNIMKISGQYIFNNAELIKDDITDGYRFGLSGEFANESDSLIDWQYNVPWSTTYDGSGLSEGEGRTVLDGIVNHPLTYVKAETDIFKMTVKLSNYSPYDANGSLLLLYM